MARLAANLVPDQADTIVSMNRSVVVPLEVVAECLAYDRCITTDEPAIDRVSLRGPSGRRSHRLVPSAAADLVRPVSRALLTTPAPQGEVSAVLLWSGDEAPQRLDVPIGRTVSRAFWMLGLAWLWVIAAVGALLTTGSVILAAVPAGIYLASRRYLVSRYCIRAQRQGRFLKLGNVSDGFRARVESVVAARGGRAAGRAAGTSEPTD